jgi:hypothetical protein
MIPHIVMFNFATFAITSTPTEALILPSEIVDEDELRPEEQRGRRPKIRRFL